MKITLNFYTELKTNFISQYTFFTVVENSNWEQYKMLAKRPKTLL